MWIYHYLNIKQKKVTTIYNAFLSNTFMTILSNNIYCNYPT